MARIVIVSHSHPSLKSGGGEVAAYRHYKHLREEGEDVAFVGAVIGSEDSRHFLGADQPGVGLGNDDFLIRSQGMDPFLMDQNDLEFETWLVNFLGDFDAEIYHFHHFWNIGAAVIRRLRALRPNALMLCTLHEFTAICANHGQMLKSNSNRLCNEANTMACANCMPWWSPLDHALRRQRMQEMLMHFDHLIAPSHFLRQRFVDWGIPDQKISMIENGVPFERQTLPADVERATKLSYEFAIFCAATPTKGLDVLVDAVAHLETLVTDETEDNTFAVNVHGASEEEFLAMWPGKDIPKSLHFNGRYNPENVIDLMSSVGWIIMPSIWWENSPVIIQEALAAQTPMIVSNIGGMHEKVSEWGQTFEVGNARSLALQMQNVMGDPKAIENARAAMPAPYHITQFQIEWAGLVADLGFGKLAAAE